MSRVVLRCPNCGTTRASPGECEACHESQVRYYCTNHAPGRWLDAPACPQCGARFGEAARSGVAPAPAAPPKRAPESAPRRFPPMPPRRSSGDKAVRPESGAAARRRPVEMPSDLEERIDARKPPRGLIVRAPAWEDLLRAATRARRRPPDAWSDAGSAAPGRRPGGCFLRFVLIVVFLFLAMASGLFVFGASLLQMFVRF